MAKNVGKIALFFLLTFLPFVRGCSTGSRYEYSVGFPFEISILNDVNALPAPVIVVIFIAFLNILMIYAIKRLIESHYGQFTPRVLVQAICINAGIYWILMLLSLISCQALAIIDFLSFVCVQFLPVLLSMVITNDAVLSNSFYCLFERLWFIATIFIWVGIIRLVRHLRKKMMSSL